MDVLNYCFIVQTLTCRVGKFYVFGSSGQLRSIIFNIQNFIMNLLNAFTSAKYFGLY